MTKRLIKNEISKKAVDFLLVYCGNLKPNEKLLIIFDETTQKLIPLFEESASKITEFIKINQIKQLSQHGLEPPKIVSRNMIKSDLIVALTSKSLAHTKARNNACVKGARYLSLAEYSLDVLENEAIFGVKKNKLNLLTKMETILNKGKIVQVKTSLGTSLELNIDKRLANNCPGFVEKPGQLGSPPDMEVNISPIEDYSFGSLIVDGSITHPELGLLQNPVSLKILKGKIYKISGQEEAKKLRKIFEKLNNPKTLVLAELGIGFNEKAKLCGNMLIDEGAANCVHFGFGSNSTVGGKNEVSFHLDFIVKNADVFLDSKLIIKKGKPLI
ncbi:MAG: hypothetical protein CBC22_03785 [Alphaproteobacteria bacterium TMED62]|nr:MAG: hypothetical protein CBC22_03785 [Alphaproteobacteria bacterium TMED62]|tara:strand:+ start:7179 stop:8165 length:987 start_codon:yes stop_codon:yes gene_type:complete